MDPIGSVAARRTDEVVSDEKRKNKIVHLIHTVRQGATSPRIRQKVKFLRRDKTDVAEPASKPAHKSLTTPVVIWSPTEIQEAKETIATILKELASLIPKTRLSPSEKQKHALTYVKGLKAILKARICHADLKPENILWGKNSFVISDFNGSFFIDRICKLMNSDFIFENEEEKANIRRIVQNLLDPLAPLLKAPHARSLKKLVDWEFLSPSALDNYSRACVLNPKKLDSLREYVATKILPPPTKGYACDLYRNAMCHYFWRCDKESFTLACHAYDMRAAALTIYAILTGAPPPDVENDLTYYDNLERSLLDFGLSKKAACMIRKMSEPYETPLDQPFALKVTLEDLDELEDELYREESPCIMVESSSDEEQNDLTNLSLLKEAFSRMHILDNDESIIKQITDDLIGSKSDTFIQSTIRLELIEGAFSAYPNACERAIEASDGKTYNTVLVIDPTHLKSCDILLKEAKIGDGGSAVAYKAFSLRSSKYVVLKYFHESADPLEANNSREILTHIGPHEAIQPCPTLFRLQIEEDYQQIAVEPYYENCDYASCIFGDLFCSNWKISKTQEAISTVLKEIDNRLQEVFRESSSPTEKHAHLHAFESENSKMFIGILGQQKVMNLFAAYKILATATPISRLRSLSRDYHDQDETDQLIQKCIRVLRNLSIIDPTELKELLETEHPSKKEEIKKKAKEVMVQSIRICQKEVFQEWLHKNTNNENPVTAAKDWKKKAVTFDDKHLDLPGIKRICKAIHLDGKIKKDPESIHQKTLIDLNKIVVSINNL